MKRGLVILVFVLLICFVSSTHVAKINEGNSVSVEEGTAFYYNFSVENTGTENITQLNITLPSELKFRATTEITDAFFQAFSNTTNTLTWNNFANYLVGINETKHFAFVGNATAFGNYKITLASFDSEDYSSQLDLEIFSINQNSLCTSNWSCGAWSGCENNFKTRTCTDLNSCEDNSTKPDEKVYCSTISCIQNWSCSNWSGCSEGNQARTCIDLNSCNNLTNKPNETQECFGNCTPAYSCTDWQPAKCDKSEIQTRICSDENNCGSILDKPEESRECKSNSHLFFIVLILIIASLIIFFVVLLIIWIKNNYSKDSFPKDDPLNGKF